VFLGYTVAAVQYLQFVLCVMLFCRCSMFIIIIIIIIIIINVVMDKVR